MNESLFTNNNNNNNMGVYNILWENNTIHDSKDNTV